MNSFRAAQARGKDWRAASDACLAKLDTSSSGASLGFLYVTDHCANALGEIFARFRQATGVQHWVGSVGMGICGTDEEIHDQVGISVMLANLPAESFRVFDGVRNDLAGFSELHRNWCRQNQSRFGIVHGDPRNPRTPELITQLAEELNNGFLVGGLTASRSTYAQVANRISEGALSGILFHPDVAVATTLSQGCAPFGEMYEITECQRNVLIRLNDRPALDVFYAEIGDVLARDLNRAAHYIGAALPVIGSDTGDYLVRNLVGIDPEQKLLAIGDLVQTGQRIQFCRRDAPSAHQDLERVLTELRDRIGTTPKAGVYYSCVGRGPHLFGRASLELETIQETLGRFPLTGFFCNGEISHNRLYGYTGVLTVFL